MSGDKHFLDTNVFVYTFDTTARAKAKRAEDLIYAALASGVGVVSYQVAQEFVAVARSRFRTPLAFAEIEEYWESTLRPLLMVHSSPALFGRALNICQADRLSLVRRSHCRGCSSKRLQYPL